LDFLKHIMFTATLRLVRASVQPSAVMIVHISLAENRPDVQQRRACNTRHPRKVKRAEVEAFPNISKYVQLTKEA